MNKTTEWRVGDMFREVNSHHQAIYITFIQKMNIILNIIFIFTTRACRTVFIRSRVVVQEQ